VSKLIISALLALVIFWEAFSIASRWRQRAAAFAGQRYSEADNPRAFWFILSAHLLLWVVAVVFLIFILVSWNT
jgi:hypothetical protein